MRYEREDGCRAWLTRAALRPRQLAALVEEHGSAEALYDRFLAEKGEFLKQQLTERQLACLTEGAEREEMHRLMVAMQENRLRILSMEDYEYPDALRAIGDPPPYLFLQGSGEALNQPRMLCVVGARKASAQGELAAQNIASGLSENGVTVVSGLALGIDTAAHRGCLEGGSPTVAVLACGLDQDYPAGNTDLRRRILDEGGAVISEYPPGTVASRYAFPVRNRIMSGMTRGTVLIEARLQSGSITTVHHALDQGREVFAYPGVPNTEYAEGAHQLLREGARYFTTAADILEDLDWLEDRLPTAQEKTALPPLSPAQQAILSLLRGGSRSLDELAAESQLTASDLSGSLTMLQLMGLVKALPGKQYCIA